jgi:hypothetical protein
LAGIDRHHGRDHGGHLPIACTSAAGRDHAGRATIAFRKSNRPDGTRADDRNGERVSHKSRVL